jgi:tetratricopeptide (TPR) repeat protein
VTTERHLGSAALTAALLVGSGTAHAQTQPSSTEEATQRAQVEQRLRLVATLLSDSRRARRIIASGSSEAVAHLDEGRVHHSVAGDLLVKGDLDGARKAADEALKHLGMASRHAPDAPARREAARARHEQMLASVDRLLESLRTRAGPAEASEVTSALGLVALSRQHAQEGRYEEANQTLSQAERHVLAGMNRTLHATTLDYTVRASTPIEEFQIELARHRGLAELIPLAVRDLQPRGDARALVERYSESRSALYGQALQQFQSGDVVQALAHLRNATSFVQRALLAAGLVAPQSTGTAP